MPKDTPDSPGLKDHRQGGDQLSGIGWPTLSRLIPPGVLWVPNHFRSDSQKLLILECLPHFKEALST